MDWLKSIRAAAPPSSSSSSPTYELLGSSSSSPDLPAPSTHPRPAYTHARRRSSTSSFNYHRARLRPHQHQHQHHGPYFHVIPPIAFVPVVVFALGFIVYHFVFRIYVVDEFVYGYPDVPDYDEYWAWEDKLPQHNTSLEFPEGANGRYVMFSNQAWGYGLNNQLQEILLLSHIAYLSHRSYVFQPYTWDAKTKSNAVLDGRSWRSSKIPLNVFISGPTAGGAFSKYDGESAGSDDFSSSQPPRNGSTHLTGKHPRAVNVNFWETVCPPSKRVVVDVGEEHKRWGVTMDTEGKVLLERWAERLEEVRDGCVEVVGPTMFDFELIASPRILSTWPSLSSSPIITRFAWSPLIQAALHRNLQLFHDRPPSSPEDEPPLLPDELRSSLHRRSMPSNDEGATAPADEPNDRRRSTYKGFNRRPPSPALSSLSLQSSSPSLGSFTTNTTTSPTIKGLIAVHLRRGDFKMHCHTLADRIEPFAGWNQFPFLLDRFEPPAKQPGVLGRGRNHQEYVKRCWPEVGDVVRRLREIRRLHTGLERVFVLTNGKKEWVEALKRALKQGGDWEESNVEVEPTTPEPSLPDEGEEGPSVLPGSIRVQPVPPPATSKAGWKEVLTSKDLNLLWTEREIDQAVDMEIARRAEVFLGNGFSSLTSNIVMLRLSDDTPIENIRFW